MLDTLLELFERDKKSSSSKRSGGLRGKLATILDGERDDDRRYDDRDRNRDRDDDDRYRASTRDDDDRSRNRDRDDDDRSRSRERDDDNRYDDDRPTSRKKKRELDFLDFGE